MKRRTLNGATREEIIDVYIKQVRSILEFGVPVWKQRRIKGYRESPKILFYICYFELSMLVMDKH